jgi:hypothetical protein
LGVRPRQRYERGDHRRRDQRHAFHMTSRTSCGAPLRSANARHRTHKFEHPTNLRSGR